MKYQAPKGTRDFFPEQMAWRNYLHDAWRRVSIRNGFEQVDGPIFESLDLYKVKSGEGIVGELFHFKDRGDRQLAIRPEFTPTLARMVAEKGASLAKPIKWFSMPNLCRAERPQRGRLREFFQWNIDVLGSDQPVADAECIFTAIDLLAELGLSPEHVRVKISHRQTVRHILSKMGVVDEQMLSAFELLDRRDKLDPKQFAADAAGLGLDEPRVARFDQICRLKYGLDQFDSLRDQLGADKELEQLAALNDALHDFGLARWCEYDLGIVRGLAYYTGTVFEIHEISGVERAVLGGGRYDQLIELFGGQSMPAVGFGMGDVVLGNVLSDKGLLPSDVAPRPDVFVIALTDLAVARRGRIVTQLRRAGMHARFTYKGTRNIGKLLKEAGAARARFAVILDDAVEQNEVALKDLTSGEQTTVLTDDLAQHVLVGT
jgi:histidyl-tRNA synthetase